MFASLSESRLPPSDGRVSMPPDGCPSLPTTPCVVDLQDQLLVAATELWRLQGLLDDASRQLLASFLRVAESLDALAPRVGAAGAGCGCTGGGLAAVVADVDGIRRDVGGATVALQFHDLATQLIEHARARLQATADVLGLEPGVAPDALAITFPDRPSPVAQREMDVGSVELF